MSAAEFQATFQGGHLIKVPRLAVVQTDDGWHGRIRAVNGKTLWWTETYARRRSAVAAFRLLRLALNLTNWSPVMDIHDVDERTAVTS